MKNLTYVIGISKVKEKKIKVEAIFDDIWPRISQKIITYKW